MNLIRFGGYSISGLDWLSSNTLREYNPHRRHSSIAYHAPMAYEKLHQTQA